MGLFIVAFIIFVLNMGGMFWLYKKYGDEVLGGLAIISFLHALTMCAFLLLYILEVR